MRPPAVRQSLDLLLGLFVVFRGRVVLGEDMEDVAMKDLNQTRMGLLRSALSVAYTCRTQSPSVRNLSDSLKFLVTHLGLLLREEAHCETIETTLRSPDSTAARRFRFIPELDEKIDEVSVSLVLVQGFCAAFDPIVPFSTRERDVFGVLLVDLGLVWKMTQMHSRFTVSAPSISRATSCTLSSLYQNLVAR